MSADPLEPRIDLRVTVDSDLDAIAETGALAADPADRGAPLSPSIVGPGIQIGPYKVVAANGEGGFGVV